jgi:sterol 14-demethylase
MVVQLEQPCRVRYRRRAVATVASQRHSQQEVAAARGCRVKVDWDLCQGHGVCATEAPEVFAVDKEKSSVRVLRESIPPELRAKAEAAVKYCPTHALSIEQDESKVESR